MISCGEVETLVREFVNLLCLPAFLKMKTHHLLRFFFICPVMVSFLVLLVLSFNIHSLWRRGDFEGRDIKQSDLHVCYWEAISL